MHGRALRDTDALARRATLAPRANARDIHLSGRARGGSRNDGELRCEDAADCDESGLSQLCRFETTRAGVVVVDAWIPRCDDDEARIGYRTSVARAREGRVDDNERGLGGCWDEDLSRKVED
jgi:hypothetical protein